MEDDFFDNHPLDSVQAVKDYRTWYIGQLIDGYTDIHWKYFFAVKFLIKGGCHDWFDFTYERFLIDGKPELDDYMDDVHAKIHRIAFCGTPFESQYYK
jgi:hypothetical protein